MVRAKFAVQRIEKTVYPHGYESTKVVLAPNYDPEIPEDQRFNTATPNGELWMIVNNPAALKQLAPGKVFYVDFNEVPQPEATSSPAK